MKNTILSILAFALSASAQLQVVNLALPVAPQPVLEKGPERVVSYEMSFDFAYSQETLQSCITVPAGRTLVIDYVSSKARGWRAGSGLPTPLQSFPSEFTLSFTLNNSLFNEHFVPYTQLFRWHPDYVGYIAGQQVKFYSKSGTKLCGIVRRYTSASNAEVKVNISGYLLE